MREAVIVVHEGKRLGIHPSYSHVHSRLRRYPIGAAVVRVRDGIVLAERVSEFLHFHWSSLPRTPASPHLPPGRTLEVAA